jgi:hypothetical protein
VKRLILILAALAACGAPAGAQGRAKLALQAAEAVIAKFGAGAAKGGVAALAARIEVSAARYGPGVFQAVQKVGPRALPLLERAGAQGARAAGIMARHGEGGAVWVVSRPAAMRLVARHGEGTAAALVRHAGVAESVITSFGAPAVRAMGSAGPQAGRRLAMMAGDGTLAKLGRTEQLLEVVAKFGDRATAFIFHTKGTLAGAAALTAFLARPEPFLDGTSKLVGAAGDAVVKPALDSVVKPVVGGVFAALYWFAGLAGLLVAGAGALAYKFGPPSPAVIKAALGALRR